MAKFLEVEIVDKDTVTVGLINLDDIAFVTDSINNKKGTALSIGILTSIFNKRGNKLDVRGNYELIKSKLDELTKGG